MASITSFHKGVLCVILANFTWIAAGVSIQEVYDSKIQYTQTLMITCLQNSFVALLLIPFFLRIIVADNSTRKSMWSLFRKMWSFTYPFTVSWLIQQILFNWSLSQTAYGVNAALTSTTSVWSYILSVLMLEGKTFRLRTIVCILITICGVVVSAFNAPESAASDIHQTPWGMLACVGAAIANAWFTVLIKAAHHKAVPDHSPSFNRQESGFQPLSQSPTSPSDGLHTLQDDCIPSSAEEAVEKDTELFLGMVGLQLAALSPFLLVGAHLTGLEEYEAPSMVAFAMIFVAAILGSLLGEVLITKSVVFISPVFVTVGLSLQTPIGAVLDALILQKQSYPMLAWVGAAIIFIGVMAVSVDQIAEDYEDEEEARRNQKINDMLNNPLLPLDYSLNQVSYAKVDQASPEARVDQFEGTHQIASSF